MFSKKLVIIVGVIILIAINIIILTVTSRQSPPSYGVGGAGIAIIAPFQEAFTRLVRFADEVWGHYFYLVSTAKENQRLNRLYNRALEKNTRFQEIELSNMRLRSLLDFKQAMERKVISAEVIGKDPSPWFRSVIIDKGKSDGVNVGFPVVVPQGIVGQITEATSFYAKVLLIIDHNNAVDGLVQRTRARGVIKGDSTDRCIFKYALRKDKINIGDTIISSGLDGVFPKGLRVGRVSSVVKRNSGIFQEVTVAPFVNFEKIEEVLVILDRPVHGASFE